MSKQIEELAIQMHLWYLEATAKLQPANYNPEAQKAYTELNNEQQDIDRYIASKVLKFKQQWQLEARIDEHKEFLQPALNFRKRIAKLEAQLKQSQNKETK